MNDIQLVGGGLSAKETLRMSMENVAPLINPKTDFANIKGKIEPTRDLILKLVDPFFLSFDTDLVKEEVVGDKRVYTFKAKVTGPDGRTVTGWGKCGTDEVSGGERADHDALTKAETRALKRAVEAKAGYGMVNQLILHFFGGYERKAEPERNATPPKPAGGDRDALLKKLALVVGTLPEAEKADIRAAVREMDDQQLEIYVSKWEERSHKKES